MKNQPYTVDPNTAARAIKLSLVDKRIDQGTYAESQGMSRTMLNLFLNRKLNLMPDDLDRIVDDLGLRELLERNGV